MVNVNRLYGGLIQDTGKVHEDLSKRRGWECSCGDVWVAAAVQGASSGSRSRPTWTARSPVLLLSPWPAALRWGGLGWSWGLRELQVFPFIQHLSLVCSLTVDF